VRFVLLPGQRFDTVGVPPLIDGITFGALIADWASPCGVEGSVRNLSTPGGWNGTETSPEAVHPRV
jgi:hypothetical protein